MKGTVLTKIDSSKSSCGVAEELGVGKTQIQKKEAIYEKLINVVPYMYMYMFIYM